MIRDIATRVLGIRVTGVVLGVVLALGTSAAAADDPAPASGGTFYLVDPNAAEDVPVGATLYWYQSVVAVPEPGDFEGRLRAPQGTGSVVSFISPQGKEADPSVWNATAPWEFTPPGQMLPDVTPYDLIVPGTGSPSGTNDTAQTDGDYSVGVAYLDDTGQKVVPGGLYFIHIHLTGNADPYKATYTWEPATADEVAAADIGQTDGPSANGLSAGILGFVSGSGGGQLAVEDGRAGSPLGWTLTAATAEGTAHTVATGVSGETPVDLPSDAATFVTLTLVSG